MQATDKQMCDNFHFAVAANDTCASGARLAQTEPKQRPNPPQSADRDLTFAIQEE